MNVKTLTGNAHNGELAHALEHLITGEVDSGIRRRAEYSTDASNYRVVPDVVVFPKSREDVIAVTEYAVQTKTPLTARGAGTSIAGNAIGPGIVMDFSKHFNRVLAIDPEAKTAVVQPGVILGQLQKEASAYGLRFGPDPSTWARCTLGGMIGNNACGTHSLSFGRTSDNVLDLEMIDGQGRLLRTSEGIEAVPGLKQLVADNLAVIRTEFGRFGRQVSGYSMEHLLPERGEDVTRALVGSEGTCGVLLEATVQLVEMPVDPILLVLGYPDMIRAAEAIPSVLPHKPGAIEGLDARLVDAVSKAQGASAVEHLPEGGGWLLLEVSGTDREETLERASKIRADAGAISASMFPTVAEARPIWRIREDGVGLAGRTSRGNQAWPGFEDAAVPPESLGAYLSDLDALLTEHSLEGMPYGHFGDGCIHLRLDIPLEKDGAALRRFMEAGTRLVASYGGSISGEHGDGRARGEMLGLMYSEEALAMFGGMKHLFDPNNILNPGVLVDPDPIDVNLRRPVALPMPARRGFAFADDGGDFTRAVHRCVGVGKCRVDNSATGGFMCPSYIATQDEKDVTRGRARVLQEMANGSLIEGWDSPEVHDALDLCLSCKACASDCPAGVDMATFKAEVLFRTYDGKIRPRTHYILGRLPQWARLAAPFTRIINPIMQIRWVQKLVLWLGGMDTRRTVPTFATQTFSRSRARTRKHPTDEPSIQLPNEAHVVQTDERPEVLVWADSFSEHFTPSIGHATIDVLEAAGYRVVFPERSVCCGLTWISTGQLDGAKSRLRALLDVLYPYVERGVPILGLEPSCTAVLRSDLGELLHDDPRSAATAQATHTLAELLTRRPAGDTANMLRHARLDGKRIIVQPHCHQHAVMGFTTDEHLLQNLGAELVSLGGCCGLAGNFGMEKGHYGVSVQVAENMLLPALRELQASDVFLADGFSCRTQADQLAGANGMHLAELLAQRLREAVA